MTTILPTLLACVAPTPMPEEIPAAEAGQRAPDFTLEGHDGADVTLSDHDGDVVLLDLSGFT